MDPSEHFVSYNFSYPWQWHQFVNLLPEKCILLTSISSVFFLIYWPVGTFSTIKVQKLQSDRVFIDNSTPSRQYLNFQTFSSSSRIPIYHSKGVKLKAEATEQGMAPSISKHLSPKWAQEHGILTGIPNVFSRENIWKPFGSNENIWSP